MGLLGTLIEVIVDITIVALLIALLTKCRAAQATNAGLGGGRARLLAKQILDTRSRSF